MITTILIFVLIMILLVGVNYPQSKKKRKPKKFGEGMFKDTNTDNWKPPY